MSTDAKSAPAVAKPAAEAKGEAVPSSYKVWKAPGPGQKVTETTVPTEPLGEDEVRVRVVATGICGSDVDALAGKYPPSMFSFPLGAGHEGVGRVVEVGCVPRCPISTLQLCCSHTAALAPPHAVLRR